MTLDAIKPTLFSERKLPFVSTRAWVRGRLLAQWRDVEQDILSADAVRELAKTASAKIAADCLGHGEITHARCTIRRVLEALAPYKADKPLRAAQLRRLRKAGRLPHVEPWL